MSIEVEKSILEKACKEMIETILFCLPNAFKGTIYRIGKSPELIAERITSGRMDASGSRISWGLPAVSEYNPPGRAWLDYRDEPGRPLEAMGWCVEKQKSWTAEDPGADPRSVRLNVEGIEEDFNHMEPVLVHKSNLNPDFNSALERPRNFKGNIIWQESDYIVVAVIKIHFKPHTIRISSDETRVIKKLSRALGTELLSYQLQNDSMKAMQQLARDRLNACDILADSLRNAITKSGLIFSLIKQEIGYLRDQWEDLVMKESSIRHEKAEALRNLNELLRNFNGDGKELRDELIDVQNRFMTFSLPPEKGERWVTMQIEERWKDFLTRYPQNEEKRKAVWKQIERLKKSLDYGRDPEVISKYSKISGELKEEWVNLLYGNDERFNARAIERLTELLTIPEFELPSRERSRKALIQLKAIAETMNQLECNTNFLLRQVLNGGGNGKSVLRRLENNGQPARK